jgi:exosome complex RNA-binding protein Csl4
MSAEKSLLALPGQLLRRIGNGEGSVLAGAGVYVTESGELRSCQSGFVIIEDIDDGKGQRWSVIPPNDGNAIRDKALLVGDQVLCRIIKIMLNQVSCDILAVNDTELRVAARGVIRREDVRMTETDQLRMQDCFRPGDIVRAVITSLGEARQYFLSTAGEDDGVRFALSKAGNIMQAVSWKEMADPVSGVSEARKVAKP